MSDPIISFIPLTLIGASWAGQMSLGTGPVDVSYNQAVTQQLSIGGQGQFSAAQQAVGLLYGFKYNTPRSVPRKIVKRVMGTSYMCATKLLMHPADSAGVALRTASHQNHQQLMLTKYALRRSSMSRSAQRYAHSR